MTKKGLVEAGSERFQSDNGRSAPMIIIGENRIETAAAMEWKSFTGQGSSIPHHR